MLEDEGWFLKLTVVKAKVWITLIVQDFFTGIKKHPPMPPLHNKAFFKR